MLIDKLISIYPSLTREDFYPTTGTILIQDDSDGNGAYIKAWEHPTLPRPTAEQLA